MEEKLFSKKITYLIFKHVKFYKKILINKACIEYNLAGSI